MARGAFRGAFGAFLTLAVLQALTTRHGSGRVAEAIADVDSLVKRAMDPNVAAVPDFAQSAAAARSEAAGNTGPAELAPVNPGAAAAADGAPRTRTDYPTNGFPFPPLQPMNGQTP